jgi:O-antigen ligase
VYQGRAPDISSKVGIYDAPFPISPWVLAAMAIVGGAIVWVSTLPYAYFLPVVLLGLVYAVWSFPRPLVALCTIILLYLHIMDKSEGISPLEIGFGLYFFGYIGYWLFVKVMIRRERVIESITDVLLLAFLSIGFLTIFIVVPSQVGVQWWFREWLTLAHLMIYFPLRDAIRTERDVKVLLWALLAMIGIVAAINLYEYRTVSVAAKYMWELLGDRKPFGAHWFFPLIVVAVSLFLHTSKRGQRVFLGGVVLLFSVALALTFTRGFWLGTMIALFVLFLIEGRVEQKTLFRTVVVMSAAGTVLLFFFAGDMGAFVLKAVVLRFTSSGNALEDISLRERVMESRAVITQIMASPIVGQGFGATFTHFNIIDKVSKVALYVHNGYLYILFKTGILGMTVFVAYYLSIIVRGLKVARMAGSSFMRGVCRGIVAVLFAMMFVVLTSNLFREKESLLILSVASAVLLAKVQVSEENRLAS